VAFRRVFIEREACVIRWSLMADVKTKHGHSARIEVCQQLHNYPHFIWITRAAVVGVRHAVAHGMKRRT